MRILGLDIGSKTIGVAISDEFGWTAQGLETLRRTSDDAVFQALRKFVSEYQVEKIVVGLPLHMSGEEGDSARMARGFAKTMQSRLQPAPDQSAPPVEFWDERLSTMGAERSLLEADMSRRRRKEVINKMAAVFILQGYLDSLRGDA